MAIVDIAYEKWQKDFEAECPDIFKEGSITGPGTALRRDLMRAAYMAGKKAARQPGTQKALGFVSQDTLDRLPIEGTGRIDCKAFHESGRTIPIYLAPPAHGIDLGHDKFRDPDHLAEWLGSLVDGNEQEEWDAAQAAMQGVRAYQGDADTILRLQAAVEGECDGLAITPEQAVAILDYVLQPLNYDDGQRDAAPGVE